MSATSSFFPSDTPLDVDRGYIDIIGEDDAVQSPHYVPVQDSVYYVIVDFLDTVFNDSAETFYEILIDIDSDTNVQGETGDFLLPDIEIEA